MKLRMRVAVLSVVLVGLVAGSAFARNPHCAGGIQYVTLGLQDKAKGQTEDYQREMFKAVDQLTACATEDPNDYEAQGYLGWAYADLDSAGPAGYWFDKAIRGAMAKGDKKKLESAIANRDHYWTMAFNDGIKAIQDAQQFQDAGAKDEAAKSFAAAEAKLTNARLLRPGNASTLRNLATAYALAGDFDASEKVLVAGLQEAAADTAAHTLADALRNVRHNKANQLVDAKRYDDAIAYYNELVKTETGDADLWMGLGNALYNRASGKQGDARKPDFKAAAEAYGKAFKLRTSDPSNAFNSALSYQNAGDLASAEAEWKSFLEVTPNDADALSGLGLVLIDEAKYADALVALQKSLEIKPEEKITFRNLAAAYNKMNNSAKATEMMFVYLSLSNGKPAPDAAGLAKTAKAGTGAANTLAAMGAPDKIMLWTDNTAGQLQTWLYGAKRFAFTFNSAGVLVQKSDWNAKK